MNDIKGDNIENNEEAALLIARQVTSFLMLCRARRGRRVRKVGKKRRVKVQYGTSKNRTF